MPIWRRRLIAEAEAFGGDAYRALEIASRELEANDEHRPLLTRVAGIALARLGEKRAAIRELSTRCRPRATADRNTTSRRRSTCSTRSGVRMPDWFGERDEILARLRIERLPAPVLA